LRYIHREFSYKSPGEKLFENRSTFAKVIIKHQEAWFLEHSVYISSNDEYPRNIRRDSVLLNRLRIGHTRLTHSFLLSGDDLLECGTCQCPLTVKHILVECVDLKDVRNKHFVASYIKDLFDNIEAHKIIDFINDTRFYKQL